MCDAVDYNQQQAAAHQLTVLPNFSRKSNAIGGGHNNKTAAGRSKSEEEKIKCQTVSGTAGGAELPQFVFTSPAESSREPSPNISPSASTRGTDHLGRSSIGGPAAVGQMQSVGTLRSPQRPPPAAARRQLSDINLLPPNGGSTAAAIMDANRRHSQSRVPFVPQTAVAAERQSLHQQQQQRLPLRAFKKIGRVGTIPALAHSNSPSVQLAAMVHQGREEADPRGGASPSGGGALSSSRFQRWSGGHHRRGSGHVGWDSARPHSAARQQQQMLERIYTKDELREYQQLFKMFDTDGSGAIGCEELKGAMKSIGLEADDVEIERLIREVDEDGNGEIDFPEFCQCMKTAERQSGLRQKPSNEEVVRQCFEVFDQDGNGVISENEFVYVAREVGGFTHDLAEMVFRELIGDSASDHLDLDRFSAIVEDYLWREDGGEQPPATAEPSATK